MHELNIIIAIIIQRYLIYVLFFQVGETDMGIYRLRAMNEHGQADCEANLVYDSKFNTFAALLSTNF